MNKKITKIAFFTEAGLKRGMGHLIRVYTIYKEFLSRQNIQADFFLDSDIDYRDKFDDIKPFQWKHFSLKEDYDLIFIDSYEADKNIYTLCEKRSQLAVYIDDYGRLQYPKGIIINFAPDADKLFFQQKKPYHAYLLGLDYLPLRKIFLNPPQIKKEQIFIMLGGSDTAKLSYTVLQSLQNIDTKKVIVVNDKDMAQSLKSCKNTQILYKPQDKEIFIHMAQSKLAITTASMSAYELSYLRIPTIIVAVSQNQLIGVSQFIKHQLAASYVCIVQNNWEEKLQNEVFSLLKSDIKITSPIDGQGTKRIVDSVLGVIK